MNTITPVVLCGGAGTRLWPLSRQSEPKQFHALCADDSMFVETLKRIPATAGFAEPVIITASGQGRRVREEALRAGRQPAVIGEPTGRNTAPVAIVAALHVAKSDPEGLVLLLPADHHVTDAEGFRQAVRKGEEAARRGHLVTLGIQPTGPETGYGYIKRGKPLGEEVHCVDRFVEKPDRRTAEDYLASGDFFWNAGIFLFRARDLLEEAQRFVPVIMEETAKAYDRAAMTDGVLHLDEASFAQVPADSIDYAIMERTTRAAVVSPVDVGWNDIGAWSAVATLSGEAHGDVLMIESEGSHVRSDGPFVATLGVKDVVVVATKDAVLVIDAKRTQDVKTIVERLKADGRPDLL